MYEMGTGMEMPFPYMLSGSIVGNGNALLNPVLNTSHFFGWLQQVQLLPYGGGEDCKNKEIA